jgi:hypothetical protein
MEAASVESLKEFCSKHSNKKLKYICLEPKCSYPDVLACIFCIKNNHVNCAEHYIVDRKELASKINIDLSGFDSSKVYESLNHSLDKQLLNFNKQLLVNKSNFIQGLNLETQGANLTPESLNNSKKNLKISYNKDTDMIEIRSRLDTNSDKFEESVEAFDKNLEKLFSKFISEFSKIKFSIRTGNLNSADFIGHANIVVEDAGSGLKFSRAPGDSTFNYFCTLCTIPIDGPCLYKLTIDTIYESDRYLDLGIVDKGKFDSIKNGGFINTFGSGAISFCGYSYTGGLTGTSLTSAHTDASGYKPGDYTYMEINPGSSIKFYNESHSNNLSYEGLSAETEYYLFVVIYHPQTSGTLERLN